MLIYKDVISGDEMFTDTYKIIDKGILYEVEGKFTTVNNDFDDKLCGANPSTEEPTETFDENTVSDVDIILHQRLKITCHNKETYKTYIKKYMGAIKNHLAQNNPERLEKFTAEAQVAVKEILTKFKKYKFYTGESIHEGGMVALLDFREDETPFMIFFKDGLISEKY